MIQKLDDDILASGMARALRAYHFGTERNFAVAIWLQAGFTQDDIERVGDTALTYERARRKAMAQKAA
jgi:hypothetical protein